MISVKMTGTLVQTTIAAADSHDPPVPRDHDHDHDHAHHHDHHHAHGGHASGEHFHAKAVLLAEAAPDVRPAFRAGLSLVRMSMRTRLAIAACAIAALWAIVLMAMM